MLDIQEIQDDSNHNYRTELPNILFGNLDPYELSLYSAYKKVAGDRGACFVSNSNLAKLTKMSLRKLIEVKAELSKPRDFLGGLPLIKVSKRKKTDGSQTSDLITIVNIWPKNMQHYLDSNNKAVCTPCIVGMHSLHGGCAPCAYEEEPIKKNHKEEKKESVKPDPVGPSFEKISFFSLDSKKVFLDQTEIYSKIIYEKVKWSSDEIQYALKTLNEHSYVVRDWWAFLVGTVNNYKNKKQSENITKSKTNQKPQDEKCEIQERLKNPSSGNVTREQLYPGSPSIMDLLNRMSTANKCANGSLNPKTS